MTLSLTQTAFDQKLAALHNSSYVPERLANFVAHIARAQRIAAEDIKIRIPKQEASAEQHAQGIAVGDQLCFQLRDVGFRILLHGDGLIVVPPA